MLHILWILMKFILILTGILLGLALLLVLLVLFCPVRYSAEAVKKAGNIRDAAARVRISWLFGGISVRFLMRQDKRKSDLRIFGISLSRLLHRKKKKRTAASPGTTEEGTVTAKKAEIHGESLSGLEDMQDDGNRAGTAAGSADETEVGSGSISESGKVPDNVIEAESYEDETTQTNTDRMTQDKTEEKSALPVRRIRNIFTSLRGILNRILERIRNIPETIRKITLKIREIYDKIDWWKELIQHPRVKAGITHVKKEAKLLLRHVFPRKTEGYVTFGSEDPSVTGAVLAVLGMTMPLHKNCVEIRPVFENRNLLEGKVKIKGRIYGIIPLVILIRLYFDKNIKYIISRWKNKED